MSDAGCAPGLRADDLFVFTPLPCALQQVAHRALVLVWFVIYVLATVELVLGQARRTDRSPLPLRAAYTLWLTGWVALLGVLVAWPDAGVGRSAPALLVLLATTMVASAALAVGIHAHLVRTLGVTLGAFYPTGPTATQRSHASRYKTALRLSVWLCVAETLLHCACAVTFAAILPNVTPPGPDADAQRERFLVAAWICACFFQGLQAATLALLTWRLRMVVHKSLVFNHSEGSGSSNGGNGGGGGGGNGSGSNGSKTKGTMRPQDVHMAQLQRRLTRNTFRLLVTSLVGAALFGVAAGLGLRFWIFHALAALGTFTIGTILAFFRPSVYASYRFGPCAASEDHNHGSVDSSTSAAAHAPIATATAPAPALAPGQRSPVLGPEEIDVDLVMEGKQDIWPASQRNSLVLGGLVIDMDELTTGIAAAAQHPSVTSLALSTTSDAVGACVVTALDNETLLRCRYAE